MLSKNKIQFLLILFGFIVGGCGPMNKSPNKNDPSSSLTNTSVAQTSKNAVFYLLVANQNTKASSGKNTYFIRLFYAPDLHLPSNDAAINVTYFMPSMPEMGISEEEAIRQADGSYKVDVFFSMKGQWQVTLKISDGSNQDEYVFEASAL